MTHKKIQEKEEKYVKNCVKNCVGNCVGNCRDGVTRVGVMKATLVVKPDEINNIYT